MKYLFIAEKPSAMREYSSVYRKHSAEISKAVGGDIVYITSRSLVHKF